MARKPLKKHVPRNEAAEAAEALAKFAAYRHAIPDGVPPFIAALADEALATIVKVMRGEISLNVRERLLAATLIRDEVCGDAATRARLAANAGLPLLQVSIDLTGRSPADKAPPTPYYEADGASKANVWQPVRSATMEVNGVVVNMTHRGAPTAPQNPSHVPPPFKPAKLYLLEANPIDITPTAATAPGDK